MDERVPTRRRVLRLAGALVGLAGCGERQRTGTATDSPAGGTPTDGETGTATGTGTPDRGPAAWRRFRYLWAPDPGEHLLVSRATDGRGRTQPHAVADPGAGLAAIEDGAYPWNQRGYGNDAYRPHGVQVTVEE